MYILKPPYGNKSGFTILELILFMAISSLLMMTFFSVLSFNARASERIMLEDEMLLNGRYAIEYIKERLISADQVILSKNFPGLDENYPTNIGFVIVEHTYKALDKNNSPGEKSKKEFYISYNYSTYYIEFGKLKRIGTSEYNNPNALPYYGSFQGHNVIIDCILEDSKIKLQDNNLVKFDISIGKDKKKVTDFKTTISLRCPVVRWYEKDT